MKSVIICQNAVYSKCAYLDEIKDSNCIAETCNYSGYCEFQRPRDDRKEMETEE